MKILKTAATSQESAAAAIELEVKKSRFLAEAFVVQSQAEARSFIKEQKAKYNDAKHVVHAFICGLNGEVMGCSDDGEPSGTAGRPVLDILKGSKCTNIMLTVTRWFGGILLGTGGLVKAYGDSAKAVLEKCVMEEYVEKISFSFECSYALYDKVKAFLSEVNAENINEQFGESVAIEGLIEESRKDFFASRLFDMTNGKVSASF